MRGGTQTCRKRGVFGMLSLVPLELFKRFGSLGVYASYVYPKGAPMLSSCLYALWVT